MSDESFWLRIWMLVGAVFAVSIVCMTHCSEAEQQAKLKCATRACFVTFCDTHECVMALDKEQP